MASFDIEEYIQSKGIDIRTSGNNVGRGCFNICCPSLDCGDERYHLGINFDTGVFHCWRCGQSGNLVKLIAIVEECSYEYAAELVKSNSFSYSSLEESIQSLTDRNLNIEPLSTTLALPRFTKPIFLYKLHTEFTTMFERIAYKYLKARNFTQDDFVITKPYYCRSGDYKNRIVFPIYLEGKLVNYVTRSWDAAAELRYKNCSGHEALVPREKLLYNYDTIKKNTPDKVILVEGIFDAVGVGLDRSLACFGIQVTEEQKKLLIQLPIKELIVMFDGGAYKQACDLVDYLSLFFDCIKAVKLPDGKDPATLSKKTIEAYI